VEVENEPRGTQLGMKSWLLVMCRTSPSAELSLNSPSTSAPIHIEAVVPSVSLVSRRKVGPISAAWPVRNCPESGASQVRMAITTEIGLEM